MNKKIGIITFHRTTNFGSSLQTYGLYKAIQKMNYDCEIIDYRCPAIEQREHLKTNISITKPKTIARRILYQPIINKKAKSLMNFTKEKMRISNMYFPSNIYLADKKYDKIFAGSDIIWGRDITNDDYNYFLEFVSEKKKKYAFASSVGSYTIRHNDSKLAELLNDFNQIAVREDEAIDWIQKLSNKKAKLVCDPTMLLTINEWEEEISTKKIYDNYVLVYFNNDNGKCLEDAIKFGKKNNKKVILINYTRKKKNVLNVKPTSLNEFLSLIKYSDMVFTASYHGMLFSLYYNKEMMFYTRAHSSRVISLAKKLDILENCGDKWDINKLIKIDYNKTNILMEKFREESINILKEMLKK